jgi:uncharacterized protein YcnI
MIKKFITGLVSLFILVIPVAASAHVVVTPGNANIGKEIVFTVSVPNEQQTAVTNFKLQIPDGVASVIPTTKDGWTIDATNTGSGNDSKTTSLSWNGGQIPVGQRQEFSFSAQVPSKATELDWKAYQTYADGTVVHWDQKPAGTDDASGNAGPYSITKVIDDLSAPSQTKNSNGSSLSLVLGLIAIIVSVGGILFHKKK